MKRYETGSVRFLTFSCDGREPRLLEPGAAQVFVEHLVFMVSQSDLLLHAFVVMPEHVHLLVTPEALTGSKALENLKKRTAAKINRAAGRSGRFWLAGGGYDRNIETASEYKEKLNYIHNNPVARGLVESALGWPHSSAAFYLDGPYSGPAITSLDTDFQW